ncbi:MAG: DUF2849 domain-containing protein [Pseudomonadota bacterium]
MPKAFKPSVVTANDLLKGDVIYQTPTGWTRRLEEAEILTDEAHAQLRLIEATQETGRLVGAYLAEVTPEGEPTHFREDFRRTGPSNYNHGKQAELN